MFVEADEFVGSEHDFLFGIVAFGSLKPSCRRGSFMLSGPSIGNRTDSSRTHWSLVGRFGVLNPLFFKADDE